jgi:uncharacterized protein (DUF1684 family)
MKHLKLLLLLILIYACNDNDTAYKIIVQDEIDKRFLFLKNNSESPFLKFSVPYRQPEYFEIDADYKVNATVERITDRKLKTVTANDGSAQTYQTYAWLHFTLKGKKQKLLVLRPAGFTPAEFLFCGFADGTSGVTTYGGGRYLDIKIGKSNKTVIDFNLAYNPYCAYASGYTCPLPPTENYLDQEIFAGEKDFHQQ